MKGRYYYFSLFFFYDVDIIYRFDDSIVQTTELEVLPGWYQLVVRRSSTKLFESPAEYCVVAFNFEAGHEYKIKWPFWSDRAKIIDVNTGVTIFSQ